MQDVLRLASKYTSVDITSTAGDLALEGLRSAGIFLRDRGGAQFGSQDTPAVWGALGSDLAHEAEL